MSAKDLYERLDAENQAALCGEQLASEPESLPLAHRLENSRLNVLAAAALLDRAKRCYTGERLPKKLESKLDRLATRLRMLSYEMQAPGGGEG